MVINALSPLRHPERSRFSGGAKDLARIVRGPAPREIPPPAGESAGVRDDALSASVLAKSESVSISLLNELGNPRVGFRQRLLVRQEDDAEVLCAGLLAEA